MNQPHFLLKTPRVTVSARGKNQNDYLNNIKQSDLTFGIGPFRDRKTFLAVACCGRSVKRKIRKIVLVRPAVEAGERLGFLPEILVQKLIHILDLYDALHDMLGAERVNRLVERDVIEIAPLVI